MILRRLGNKKKIAKKIQAYFPPHKIYIEPFFGAGGMFFNKPKAKYNIVNDLDSDVFNLFQVVMNQKEELEKAFYLMPIHSDLLDYWKKNLETDPIKKALRFLLLSNFTLMGTGNTLSYGDGNTKNVLLKKTNLTFELLKNVWFNNTDFASFLIVATAERVGAKKDIFIYADPPYLDVDKKQNEVYKISTWSRDNVTSLFDTLQATKCRFAYSEFDNPFIIQQANERGLNIIEIGERQNLKNRRTEILVTNYKTNQLKLF